MCMIALRPEGQGNIPNAVIDTAIARHSDGFGLAYRTYDAEGVPTLHSERFGPDQRKQFRRSLKRIDRTRGEYVAHFRFATHGAKDSAHAHPYQYEDPDPKVGTVYVFHNGVISIRTDGAESDTEVFVRDVLANLPSRWWTQPALRFLVTEAIDWSKFVIMTADETVNMHDARGDWDGGIWYSSAHKPVASVHTWTKHDDERWGHWDNEQQAWIMPDGTSAKSRTSLTGIRSLGTASTSIVPYKGRAAKSAAALGLLDTAERDVDCAAQFRHGGHELTAIKDINLDKDGDWEDSVICETCATIGTVYVIDGAYYIEMAHTQADNDDEDALLPVAHLSAV